MGSLKSRHLRLPPSWGFHPTGEFVLLGRTDSTIAGFWAAFIAEVWHQRAGLHHQCLCLWEGPAFPHCPHCATEVVPFGFVMICPIHSHPGAETRNLPASRAGRYHPWPNLADSVNSTRRPWPQYQLPPLQSWYGSEHVGKTQTPNGPSLFPHENAQSSVWYDVIWCDMMWKKIQTNSFMDFHSVAICWESPAF